MENIDLVKGMSLNFWFEVGTVLALIGVGYLVGLIKKQFKLKTKTLRVSWSTHSQIHELLTELRINLDAARAQIIQFHNGEYFMDGISMKKLSLTHESLSKGVSAESPMTTDLLISLFTPLMQKVLLDDPILYKTVDDEHGVCRNIMQASNTVGYAVLPLKCRNMTSGYIIVQWCSETKVKKTNDEEIKQYLVEARDHIGVYLKNILREENA